MERDKAAFIIQNHFRKRLANDTRNDMLARGEDWQSDIKHFSEEIKNNVDELHYIRRNLNLSERVFLSRFMRTEFYATHATNAADVIDENDDLVLYSYRKLQTKDRNPSTHKDTNTDITRLGNDNYVYFSLESGRDLQKPFSRFGQTIYRMKFNSFNFLHADLLLVDQLLTWPYGSVINRYPHLFSIVDKEWQSFSKFSIHFTNNRVDNAL